MTRSKTNGSMSKGVMTQPGRTNNPGRISGGKASSIGEASITGETRSGETISGTKTTGEKSSRAQLSSSGQKSPLMKRAKCSSTFPQNSSHLLKTLRPQTVHFSCSLKRSFGSKTKGCTEPLCFWGDERVKALKPHLKPSQ